MREGGASKARQDGGRYRWSTREVDPALADDLVDGLGVPRPLARLLAGRGVGDVAAARDFLSPRLSCLSDPFDVSGMSAAVDAVLGAMRDGRRITVFGDYDVDGVTGAALLSTVLSKLGQTPRIFIPKRTSEGYGLSKEALARCLSETNPELLVTVDCGSRAEESVREALRAGVATVVTDHHEIEPGGEPSAAAAVVNPKLGAPAAAADLAGVGVAFKLCHALLKRLAENDGGRPALDLREHLDWVALGTVCDMVPLHKENRILASHGMRRLESTASPGLMALKSVAGLSRPLTGYDLGFRLGPRLNAPGRLTDAGPALDLLLAADADRAVALAQELDAANRERQQAEKDLLRLAERTVREAFDETETFGLCAGGAGWDIGVAGIVASQLCRRFGRPAIVVGYDRNGDGRGSCRGVDGVDMMEILGECASWLDRFGGHKAAAGLSLRRDKAADFTAAFNEACARRLKGRDLRPMLVVDAWLTHLGEADGTLIEQIDRLRPLGESNPPPIWAARGVRTVGPPRPVGKDGAHLKLTLASGGSQMDAIAFGMGQDPFPDGALDVAFELEWNTYRGRTAPQMKVRDLRPAAGEG